MSNHRQSPAVSSRIQPEQIWSCRAEIRHQVKICLFWTRAAREECVNPAPASIQRASSIFARHNLTLSVCPSQEPTDAHTLDFPRRRIRCASDDEIEDRRFLRQLAHEAHVHNGRLPVIISLCEEQTPWIGLCCRLDGWLPFVILNAERQPTDGSTMCHEIVHAAGCRNDYPVRENEDYSTYRYVMINNLPDRNCIKNTDVWNFAGHRESRTGRWIPGSCYFSERA